MNHMLTVADLDAGLQRDDYLGFGYLGERRNFFSTYGMSVVPQIEAADTLVLFLANAHGYDAERLFEWANSKSGRWAGEILMTGQAPTFANPLPREAKRRAATYIN